MEKTEYEIARIEVIDKAFVLLSDKEAQVNVYSNFNYTTLGVDFLTVSLRIILDRIKGLEIVVTTNELQLLSDELEIISDITSHAKDIYNDKYNEYIQD